MDWNGCPPAVTRTFTLRTITSASCTSNPWEKTAYDCYTLYLQSMVERNQKEGRNTQVGSKTRGGGTAIWPGFASVHATPNGERDASRRGSNPRKRGEAR